MRESVLCMKRILMSCLSMLPLIDMVSLLSKDFTRAIFISCVSFLYLKIICDKLLNIICDELYSKPREYVHYVVFVHNIQFVMAINLCTSANGQQVLYIMYFTDFM